MRLTFRLQSHLVERPAHILALGIPTFDTISEMRPNTSCTTMNSRPRSPSLHAASSTSISTHSNSLLSRIEPPSIPFSTSKLSPPSSSTAYSSSTSLLLENSQSLLSHQAQSTPGLGTDESKCTTQKDLPPCHPTKTINKRIIRRKVRFNPAVRGKFFEHTQQELQDKWYPETQFGHFEEQMRADVKLVRLLLKKQEREPLDNLEAAALEATPTRGIEQFLSKSVFVDRTAKQQAVVHGVLAAQHRRSSADHVAVLSSNLSHEARERALQNGLFDATEAAKCHLHGLV